MSATLRTCAKCGTPLLPTKVEAKTALPESEMLRAVRPHCQHPACPWCILCVAAQSERYRAAREALKRQQGRSL